MSPSEEIPPDRGGGLNSQDPRFKREALSGGDDKIEQLKIIKRILGIFEVESSDENIEKIKNTGLGDITEYGRVVHGEMEALFRVVFQACLNRKLWFVRFFIRR